MIEVLRKLPKPALAMMVANVFLFAAILFSPALMWSCVCLMAASMLVVPAATARRHGEKEMHKILAITSALYVVFAMLALLPFLLRLL